MSIPFIIQAETTYFQTKKQNIYITEKEEKNTIWKGLQLDQIIVEIKMGNFSYTK